jgi:hypothetical protein
MCLITPITHFVYPSSSDYLDLTELVILAFASSSLLPTSLSILYDTILCNFGVLT